MGISYNPSIVTNGLVLALDAGNTKSYLASSVAFGNFITPALMNSSSVYAPMLGVTVNSSGLFVAVGIDTILAPLYATSTDGSTWTTPARMNGSSVEASMSGVTVNSSGLFVAVGFDSTSAPVYTTSTNGSTWATPARMNGSSVYAQIHAITVNSSGLFVAVGFDSTSAPVYATSSNGSTWTTPARMNGSSVYAQMRGITVNSSGLFVAVGYDSTNAPLYATSTNGSTWTTPALMNGSTASAQMRGITVNSSGLFVAVGSSTGTARGLYATSTNGSTWTTPAIMNAAAVLAVINGVTVDSSGRFVAVGRGTSNVPIFATSTDGSTWTTPAAMNGSATGAIIYGVAVNSSGLFVAVGSLNTGGFPVYATSTTTASTSWNDLSGNANNSTLTNGPTYNSSNGGSIVFDGVNDYAIGTSNLSLSGNPAFTISYWARWDGATFSTDYPSGVGNNSTGVSNTGVSTTWSSGRIALDFWNNRFRANSALNVQQWYHVSFVKTAGPTSSTVLYVNGVSVPGAVENGDLTPNITASAFVVGRLDATRWFQGKINGVMVYNRALSATEIQQNFNALRGRYGI